MVQISINTQRSQLILTVPRPPSLLQAALAAVSRAQPSGDVFVFDRQADTLVRNGRKVCALSQFQSARIDKRLGGGGLSDIRYGLSILLVDGRKIALAEPAGDHSLEELNRTADAVSRYTGVHIHREE